MLKRREVRRRSLARVVYIEDRKNIRRRSVKSVERKKDF